MTDFRLLALGPAPADAAAVAILAHGRGGSPEDMAQLASALDCPEVSYLLPGAPGNTWYPQSFMAPIAANEPFLGRSLANHARILADLIGEGIPPGRIVLGGFSQGACLTAETLVRAPRRYGGAFIFTGGLIGPPGTSWTARPDLAGTPIYISGSEVDPHVPADRARETAQVFTDSGAAVELKIFASRPHVVTREEIGKARACLRAVVAGS